MANESLLHITFDLCLYCCAYFLDAFDRVSSDCHRLYRGKLLFSDHLDFLLVTCVDHFVPLLVICVDHFVPLIVFSADRFVLSMVISVDWFALLNATFFVRDLCPDCDQSFLLILNAHFGIS